MFPKEIGCSFTEMFQLFSDIVYSQSSCKETITRPSREKKDSSIVKETFFASKYSFELNLVVQLPLKVTVLMRPLRIERRNMLIGNTGAEHFIIGILFGWTF